MFPFLVGRQLRVRGHYCHPGIQAPSIQLLHHHPEGYMPPQGPAGPPLSHLHSSPWEGENKEDRTEISFLIKDVNQKLHIYATWAIQNLVMCQLQRRLKNIASQNGPIHYSQSAKTSDTRETGQEMGGFHLFFPTSSIPNLIFQCGVPQIVSYRPLFWEKLLGMLWSNRSL